MCFCRDFKAAHYLHEAQKFWKGHCHAKHTVVEGSGGFLYYHMLCVHAIPTYRVYQLDDMHTDMPSVGNFCKSLVPRLGHASPGIY